MAGSDLTSAADLNLKKGCVGPFFVLHTQAAPWGGGPQTAAAALMKERGADRELCWRDLQKRIKRIGGSKRLGAPLAVKRMGGLRGSNPPPPSSLGGEEGGERRRGTQRAKAQHAGGGGVPRPGEQVGGGRRGGGEGDGWASNKGRVLDNVFGVCVGGCVCAFLGGMG